MEQLKIKNNSRLTFANEGQNEDENKLFFTLKPHCPSSTSGVTLGKGYDMKMRSKEKILKELKASGIDDDIAALLSNGAGLSGKEGESFCKKTEIAAIRITKDQEIKLFNLAYSEAEEDVKRICTKPDVVKKYGKCDWDKIDDGIKEFLIDLRFRGDYSGMDGRNERSKIQKAAVSNDYDELIKQASDNNVWNTNLDGNRFSQRIFHLETKKKIFNINKGKASDAPTVVEVK